jgi:hypothetical protein
MFVTQQEVEVGTTDHGGSEGQKGSSSKHAGSQADGKHHCSKK